MPAPRPFLLALLPLALVACDPRRPTGDREREAGLPPMAAGTTLRLAPTFFGADVRVSDESAGWTEIVIDRWAGDRAIVDWSRRVAGEGGQVEVVRGRTVVADLDDGLGMTPPSVWVAGESTVDTLVWLSSKAFAALADEGETAWSYDLLSDPAGTVLERFGGQRGEARLTRRGRGRFEVVVDGERRTLPTIRATDTLGNRLVVVDDPECRLVVELTYQPVSGGAVDVFGLGAFVKGLSGYRLAEASGP